MPVSQPLVSHVSTGRRVSHTLSMHPKKKSTFVPLFDVSKKGGGEAFGEGSARCKLKLISKIVWATPIFAAPSPLSIICSYFHPLPCSLFLRLVSGKNQDHVGFILSSKFLFWNLECFMDKREKNPGVAVSQLRKSRCFILCANNS